jgi:hypothetical protein
MSRKEGKEMKGLEDENVGRGHHDIEYNINRNFCQVFFSNNEC